MPKANKKLVRKNFRDACFKRDKLTCAVCKKIKAKSLDDAENILDAHHIVPRTQMPNGGYVKENGISLCSDCHIKAEEFYSKGIAVEGYSVDDLFAAINSNLQKAIDESIKL